ncbi:MAG: 50S ribosomal protein L35 [Nitrospirota bacterium]
MKLKTHRGAAKRFRRSATGKFMSTPTGRRHLLTDKKRGRKRQLKGNEPVDRVDQAALRRLLPYA